MTKPQTEQKIDKAISDIIEDLMVGHNWDYAHKAIKEILTASNRELLERVQMRLMSVGENELSKWIDSELKRLEES